MAAGSCNSMMITSGGVSEVVTSGKGPKVWWQYTTAAEFRSKEQIAAFAEKLEDQGCSGISVTVDIYVVSHRERSMHNGLVRRCCQVKGVPRNDKGEVVYQPEDVLWTSGDAPTARPFATPAWDTQQRLREASKLPVVVKGVLTSEDAERAVKHGMSGISVSNHGARQLDQVGSTIEALPECPGDRRENSRTGRWRLPPGYRCVQSARTGCYGRRDRTSLSVGLGSIRTTWDHAGDEDSASGAGRGHGDGGDGQNFGNRSLLCTDSALVSAAS